MIHITTGPAGTDCTECGAKWQMSGSWDANNFCGNCGAKMDEEVE